MGRRSQRRPLRYEKDQGGCISGLMSMFDFRHDRSTRKLLADRRQGSRQAASTGVGSSSSRPTAPKSKDKHKHTKEAEESDAVKTSVKELMEEEMINEQVPQKQIDIGRVGSKEFNSENGNRLRKRHKQRNRSSTKSIDMDIYNWDTSRNLEHQNLCQQINEQKILDDIDVETIIGELCQIHHGGTACIGNDLTNYPDMQSDPAYAVVQDKLIAAINVFMSQTLDNSRYSRKDGKIHRSKEFMDALETVSSYKDLFLKLLQDPNSLLVKHIKALEGAQLTNDGKSNSLTGPNFLEEVPTKSESVELINRKHQKFFRRRSKAQDSYPFEGDKICRSSSKIVILKPGPAGARYPHNEKSMTTSLHSHDSVDNEVESEKSASHFSFTEIKRRLKHAMGKERQEISSKKIIYKMSSEHIKRGDTEKGVGGENLGWSSPNRNHFYTERFAKPSNGFRRVDKIGKSKDVEATVVNESSSYHKQGASNIYIEAKKHLSEMLNNGEANAELIRGQLPKSLGRILSLPDYKDSERCNPEKDTEDSFVTARMRLSHCGTSCGVNDNTYKLVEEKHDNNLSSCELSIDNQTYMTEENYHGERQSPDANHSATCEVICDNAVEEPTPEGILKIDRTTKTTDQEEDEVLNVPEISVSTTTTSEDVNDNVALCNEETPYKCLKLRSLEEGQESSSPPISPSCSSVNSKVEDPEKAIERADRPSPISVLEPLFSEEDISPASTMHRQVQQDISPRKIHFEEETSSANAQGICISCTDDGESPFDYVEAVLFGSDLNWDEYLLRWLSSDQILDPALIDEVELFASRPHDQKLLFDFTNKVLKDVCDRYFGRLIGISSIRQSIRPAPRGMNLINEIWEGVEWHLVQHPMLSSDQLVKKDVTESGMWMNLLLDFKHIGIEMQEAIFEELVEDTISSFVDDNPESMSIAFPAEPHETGMSVNS